MPAAECDLVHAPQDSLNLRRSLVAAKRRNHLVPAYDSALCRGIWMSRPLMSQPRRRSG